jgi:hypothetical protein
LLAGRRARIPDASNTRAIPPGESRKGKAMNKPTHFAYVVTESKEGSDKKGFWHRVGTVWPHKNGPGFDIVIPDGISVSGRIVCTEPKEKE